MLLNIIFGINVNGMCRSLLFDFMIYDLMQYSKWSEGVWESERHHSIDINDIQYIEQMYVYVC